MKPVSVLSSLLLVLAILPSELHAAPNPSLVPAPVRMELDDQHFAINSETRISSPEPWLAEQLAEILKSRTGIDVGTAAKAGTITLSLTPDDAEQLGNEGYRIRITPERAVVTAAHRNGLFYGTVTLRQLLTKNDDATWSLPCGEIDDQPRFGWRGLMLDPARTFMAIEEVRRFVDVMAFYKLNVLHLHLTDEQAWRFESKLYPQLTEKASTFGDRFKQPPEFSGFYTQDELKGLVSYAAQRGISILPEIEMPGHSRGMLVVFPEFSSVAKPFPPYMVPAFMEGQVKGLQGDGVNPTNLEFDAFIDKIFGEVAEVFPFPYLHIGGDEMQFEIWMKNPKIVSYMKEKGIKGPNELQAHFIERMDKLVQKNGRTTIAWDEVLNGGAPKDAVIMSWRGRDAVKKALKSGARIVATPNNDLYLQRPQGPPDPSQKLKPGHARNPSSYNTLRKMYVYDPCAGLDEKQSRQIMGIQGCMWMAIAKSVPEVQVMVFPRLTAIAESAWTQPDKKDYADFYRRMLLQNSHLDRFGMRYWKDSKGFNAPDSGYNVPAPKPHDAYDAPEKPKKPSPISPPSGPARRLVQGPPVRSNFLAAPTCSNFEDTPYLNQCPAIRRALDIFECPLLAVRLMRLGPGSIIKEHCDHDLDFEQGTVRLHIPVTTNDKVAFRLNGELVALVAGSCWYLRLSDRHSVSNEGAIDRVHLVIGASVNEWLEEELRNGSSS